MVLTILTVLGWLCAAAFTAAACSSATRTVHGYFRKPARRLGWGTPLLYTVPGIAALTGLGVITAWKGAVLAVVLAVAYGFMLRASRKTYNASAVTIARADAICGFAWLQRDIKRALAALRGPQHDESPVTAARQDPAPTVPNPAARPEPVRPVPAPRPDVPSLREDPNLGQPPHPAEVATELKATGAAIPPAWAALCDEVRSFEPDTDEDHLQHMAGHTAGILALSDAFREQADHLQHAIGLDPAYVAGHHEFADEFADLTGALAMVTRRFHAIYGTIRDWVAGGGILPHNAREWLQAGGDTETGNDGDIAA